MMSNFWRRVALGIFFCFTCVPLWAQVDDYEAEYKRLGSIKTIATYGTDMFGDKVNLYTGKLEFNQTDVSLPGNSALKVFAGRR